MTPEKLLYKTSKTITKSVCGRFTDFIVIYDESGDLTIGLNGADSGYRDYLNAFDCQSNFTSVKRIGALKRKIRKLAKQLIRIYEKENGRFAPDSVISVNIQQDAVGNINLSYGENRR